MYKVTINNKGSFVELEFHFKSMEETSIFVDTVLTASEGNIECHVAREEEN
jgi:hypothetical protein